MELTERKNRIIARGEFSDHCHVVVGDATIRRTPGGNVIVEVGKEGAVLKHLLESQWVEGKEAWTKEHKDVPIEKGTYEYIQQQEYDPFLELIRDVED